MTAIAVDALDGVRRWLWRVGARTSLGRACVRDRSTRILALGLGHVAVSLILAALFPAAMLIVGPLVLGVPHVVADLRYLVVRGPASLRPSTIIAVLVPLAAMTGFGIIEILGGNGDPQVEVGLGCAAVAIAVVLAPGGFVRRVNTAATVVAVAIPATMRPDLTLIALLFAHNIVALAIWCGWTKQTVRIGHRAIVIGAVIAGVALIMAGAFDRSPDGAVIARLPYFDVDPMVAYRMVVAYAFLQAVHYVVWLRLIPATQARSPAASTFKKSIAKLRADFGAGLVAIAAVTIAVPVLAVIADTERVRDGYLSLVLFHAWLELAIVAYAYVTRERLG